MPLELDIGPGFPRHRGVLAWARRFSCRRFVFDAALDGPIIGGAYGF